MREKWQKEYQNEAEFLYRLMRGMDMIERHIPYKSVEFYLDNLQKELDECLKIQDVIESLDRLQEISRSFHKAHYIDMGYGDVAFREGTNRITDTSDAIFAKIPVRESVSSREYWELTDSISKLNTKEDFTAKRHECIRKYGGNKQLYQDLMHSLFSAEMIALGSRVA